MKLGFALPVAGAWATPENQVRVAQHAERLGYSGLWVLQRLLYALEPKGHYPPMPNQPVAQDVRERGGPDRGARLRGGPDLAHPARHQRAHHALLLARFSSPSSSPRSIRSPADGSTWGWGSAGPRTSSTPPGCRSSSAAGAATSSSAASRRIWTEDVVEFHGDYYHVPRSRVPAQAAPEATSAHHHRRLQRRGDQPRGEPGRRLQRRQHAAGRACAARRAHPRGGGQGRARPRRASTSSAAGRSRCTRRRRGPAAARCSGPLAEIREDIQRYAEAGLTELFLEGNFTLADSHRARARADGGASPPAR